MRAAGALLCHDAERDRALSDPIEIQKNRKEDYIRIEPHTDYGRPGPLAHKIFVAFIKKHSDYGRPVQSDVSFTKRELMRLVGRKEWGGKDSEELSRALYEIRRTAITAFFNTDDRYIERDFNIFNELYFERRNSYTDPIELCRVTIAEPIIQSLRDLHFTCLNHFLMRRLGCPPV